MTAAELLGRAEAAGAVASLAPDGRVRIAGAGNLPAGLLDLLRGDRDGIAAALAARRAAVGAAGAEAGSGSTAEPDPEDAAECASTAEHHAAPPDPDPWRPGDPDPPGAGLLAGWHAARAVRLAAIAERLEVARPKRWHGVRALDWQV